MCPFQERPPRGGLVESMVPPESHRPKPPGRPFSERIRSHDARTTSGAVALSTALHLVLFLLLLAVSGPVGPRLSAPEWMVALVRPIAGERLIVLVPPTQPDPPPSAVSNATPVELPSLNEFVPEPPISEPEERPPLPGDAPGAESRQEVGAGESPDPGAVDVDPRAGSRSVPVTAADRLQPTEKDPRLWFVLPEEIVGLSPEQIAQLDLALAVEALQDSMAVAAALASRGTDWTYTDAEGQRWGIAPGQSGGVELHLGGITIPLPFGFAPPPNSMAARRAREDAEIAAQVGRQEAARTLRDRAAEIRRRRDAERASERAETDTASATTR